MSVVGPNQATHAPHRHAGMKYSMCSKELPSFI